MHASSLLHRQTYDVSIPYTYRDIEITLEVNEFLIKINELKIKINELETECSNSLDNLFCGEFRHFLNQHLNKLIDKFAQKY